LEPAALENLDVAIFADAKMLREHGRTARQMGSTVVDASGSLEGDSSALVRSPLVGDAAPLGLESTAVRAAHPVATMLALVLLRAASVADVKFANATVLQPASEHGRAGLEELQQQTINLLSFQSVPQEEFDAQVAFNLLSSLGESAKTPLALTEERILADLKAITGGKLAEPGVQLVQAPVFHGYAVSLFVEFERAVTAEAVAAALTSEHVEVVGEDEDAPSNLTSAGQAKILARVKASSDHRGVAVWMTADNLKLRARTAVACAMELTRMRPLGGVQ